MAEESKGSLSELLCTDLKLARGQWEERPLNASTQGNQQYLEIDCLIHDEWLSLASRGGVCSRVFTPPVCREELHWLLQPSCDSLLPAPWQRVHISCLRKESSGYNESNRMLVSQCNGFSMDSIHEFLTQVAQENFLLSWRETLEKVQGKGGQTGGHRRCSNGFVRQIIKQLYDVEVKRIGRSTENRGEPEQPHANLAPLLTALESRDAFYLVFPYSRFTLFDAAMHSPAMIDDSVAKALFVLFQLLKLLSHVHSKGITLGDISLKTVFVDTRLWVQIRPHLQALIGTPRKGRGLEEARTMDHDLRPSVAVSHSPTPTPLGNFHSSLAASTLTLTEDDPSTSWSKTYSVPDLPLSEAVTQWRQGSLSNFDYLMLLNHHAGRVIGDPNNHPIFPWVMDFTTPDAGFRDLTKSKHFLTKGEDQLNFTFLSALEEMKRSPDQDPLVPHHIGDISSDVTYYVYLARKTPKEVLCSHVRPRWVPEEYPTSMEKMFIWSPDECIPEFYIDTSVFKSIHPDLPDLQVPVWVGSPEEFVRAHRSVLEGDIVSSHLHHWIDLVFGYKLTGHDAIKAKNVYLSVVDKHKHPTNSGIVQLFKSSHPKRSLSHSAPFVLQEWSSYLHKSSLMNVSSFPIDQTSQPDPTTPGQAERTGKPNTSKTFEAILSQESAKKRALPDNDSQVDLEGQENQEEEFYGSFEHVNLPELKTKSPRTTPTTNNDPGVRDSPLPDKTPLGSKVKGDRDSVVMSGTQQRFRVPVVDRLLNRQRRPQAEGEVGYEWQTAEVNLPKEAHLLDRLTRLEELSHFVSKSCKDEGDLFTPESTGLSQQDEGSTSTRYYAASRVQDALVRSGEDPSYYPSFEERVGMDITAVTCTVIELCCVRQLRAAIPASASLAQRVGTIRKLIKSGQLKLPSFLHGLVDFVLSPDTPTSTPVTHLPTLTSTLLLQPFLPVVAFPAYFEPLYKFIFNLEQRTQQTPLGQMTFNLQKLQLQALPSASQKQLDCILEFISFEIKPVLKLVSNEGFPLLLLHLFPFFTYPDTSFDAMFLLLDPLAQRMGRRNVERLFSIPLIHLFDTATEPHQRGQLLSRTTAHMLIKRFGLSAFLSRFLGFVLEAVLEPFRASLSKPSTVKRVNANIMRAPSQSVLALVTSDMLQSQAFDDIGSGRGRKADLSFSLALSDVRRGYDSDKDDSSDESDGELQPEASILAKTGMYIPALAASELEAPLSSSLFPLSIDTRGTGTIGPSSPVKPGGLRRMGSPRSTQSGVGNPPVSQEESLEYSLLSGSSNREGGMIFDDDQDGDSRGGSPTTMNEGSLTTSMISESMDSFEGFRDERSNSFGGLSSLGGKRDDLEEDLSDEDTDGGEEDTDDAETRPMCDPVTFAVNVQIANIAADSLCWLIRRLGPLLATQHLVRPLLDGLHRCFSGVVNTSDRYGPVIKCLSSFVDVYGEDSILKLIEPRAETLVTAAMGRMSVKAEAGVAASLALMQISIRQLTQNTLAQDSVSKSFCDNYFIPLIQLLSSQTTFPSSGEGRAAICRSMVDLLLMLGEKLGREEANKVLTPTLQCFFACFSGVHSHEEETQLSSNGEEARKNGNAPLAQDKSKRLTADDLFDLSVTPTEQSPLTKPSELANRVIPESTPVDIHPLTPVVPNNGIHDNSLGSTPKAQPSEEPLNSESYRQVCATFSKAMAHAGYVPFCRLLGQHNLNNSLYNTDLIEHIAYKQDAENQTSAMPVVLTDDTDEDSDVSSGTGSDSDDDPVHDAVTKVGPVSVVTSLGNEEAGLGRSLWFVSLEDSDKSGTGGEASHRDKTDNTLRGSLLHMFKSTDSSTDSKPDNLRYHEAMFDAKFSGLAQQTTPLETPVSAVNSMLVKGVGVAMGGVNIPVPFTEREDRDLTLKGGWSYLWEKQLHRSVHSRDTFGHFRGLKLQTFTGHKGTIRGVAVDDSEHWFVSASKDKTAKVWKLGNHGDGSSNVSCCLTYSGHSKAVLGVELLEGMDQVVSCDGSVHVWDIETGYSIQQFQPSHGTQFSALRALSSSQPVVAVATNSDLQLRLIDLRTQSYMQHWKLQFPTGGTIRCLACSENWIAVGNYNGLINTLDIRTGELLWSWKPSDFYPNPATSWNDALLQLKSTRRGNLVSSVGQGLLSLWRPTYGKLIHPLKCPPHPTHCLEVSGDQLISVSHNGYLVVHDGFETNREGTNLSMKTRNRGITTLTALQENHLLLLGNDYGQVTLMA